MIKLFASPARDLALLKEVRGNADKILVPNALTAITATCDPTTMAVINKIRPGRELLKKESIQAPKQVNRKTGYGSDS